VARNLMFRLYKGGSMPPINFRERGQLLNQESEGMRMYTKKSWSAVALFLIVVMVNSQALAWAQATHAYIGYKLGNQVFDRQQAIYGAMAPDCFNYLFALPQQSALYDRTHHYSLSLYNQAKGTSLKALALGFVSHDDFIGADRTAHHNGRTYGQEVGYVIAKASDLLTAKPDLLALVPEDTALDLCHNFVETAVDVLMKRLDPRIGKRVSNAARLRDPGFPDLLWQTYGSVFSGLGVSQEVVTAAEEGFRTSLIAYGQALQLPEEQALAGLASQMADLAAGYLASKGITLPLTKEQITGIIIAYLVEAMALCQDDFAKEIAKTIHFVRYELKFRGVK
jgi:hypothetical protein